MFEKHGTEGYQPALPGIRMKTICYGARTLMTEFVLQQGSTLPAHSHPHEQVSYVAEGEIILLLDDQETRLGAGDVFLVPSGRPHSIQQLTEHVRLVDCFTPIREDFLK